MVIKHSYKGFTLIELIIVIVILGVIAVSAAPRFLNLQLDAGGANLNGLKAAIESAMKVVYAKAVVEGVEKEQSATVEGIAIAYGYPQATEAALAAAIEGIDDYMFVGTVNAPQPYIVYTYRGNNNVNSNQCSLAYFQANDTNRAYVEVTGEVCGGKPPAEVFSP